MIGVFLVSISTFFEEIFDSIGKYKLLQGQQSIHTTAFFSLLGGALVFVALALFNRDLFSFSYASLPTFIPRTILELVQTYFTIAAIREADRTTFGFIRTSSIPLLLLIDVALGYRLTLHQFVGVGVILATLFLLFDGRSANKKGLGLVSFSAVNAVVGISFYKYDITYFNSVVAEQGIVYVILIIYFLLGALFIAKENPFSFLTKPIFLAQVGAQGVASVLESFAYSFAPASIIIAAKRSSAMMWTIISGNMYFRETNVVIKVAAAILLVGGIILLIW